MVLGHVAGVPVEEMAPVLATGAPLLLAGLYRRVARLSHPHSRAIGKRRTVRAPLADPGHSRNGSELD
jgi:hypothetical protein